MLVPKQSLGTQLQQKLSFNHGPMRTR